MELARRDRLVVGFAFVACLWPLCLLAALLFVPRWYLLDDWRESLIRVAFFTGLVATPVSAVLAIVLAKRSGDAMPPRLRAALWLAWMVLGLLALAGVALLVFIASMET